MDKGKKNKRTNNDLQNITDKTKDQVTRTPLNTWAGFRCSGRLSSSCSTSDTRRVNLATNHVINHERRKDQEVFTTSGFEMCSFLQPLLFPHDRDFYRRRDVVLPHKVHSQSC